MNNEETLLIKAFLGLRRCYVDYVIAEYQVGGFITSMCVCVCVRGGGWVAELCVSLCERV